MLGFGCCRMPSLGALLQTVVAERCALSCAAAGICSAYLNRQGIWRSSNARTIGVDAAMLHVPSLLRRGMAGVGYGKSDGAGLEHCCLAHWSCGRRCWWLFVALIHRCGCMGVPIVESFAGPKGSWPNESCLTRLCRWTIVQLDRQVKVSAMAERIGINVQEK